MPTVHDALPRFAKGCETQADREWLRQVAATWVACDGKLPVDRIMRAEHTEVGWNNQRRDRALARAVRLVIASNPELEGQLWKPYSHLEAEWRNFLTAGPWRLWRDDDRPPATATPLQRELFLASRHSKGEPLSAQQIRRNVRSVDKFSDGNVNGSSVP